MKKVALVTGASRGIGAETARRLSSDGWKVIVNYYRSEEAAMKLAEELDDATAICADVSNEEQVALLYKKIRETCGGIDLLVNNAGIAHQRIFTDTTISEWRELFSVNVEGAFNCTKLALPHMINQKSGVIINISSIWGIVGSSCEVAYSASKAALIGLTKALAKEVGPSGIRVNCIAPGIIDTDMNSDLAEETVKGLCIETPLGSFGEVSDVAELVCFLASDKAKFITGQVISPNGGFSIY